MSEADKHYQTVPGEQHHARAIRLGLNWYQGNITKYAERAPHKGSQSDDLIKVLDYTTMWLENTQIFTKDQELKLRLIAARLNSLGGSASGAKQTGQILGAQNPTYTELSPLRNFPGDKSVIGPDEPDPRYVNQDRHPREIANGIVGSVVSGQKRPEPRPIE